MAMRPSDDYDRDILDIIPERFDADADSHQARAGHRLRAIVTITVAVIAVGAIVAAGLHFLGGRRGGGLGVPVIKADDRPIKIRPDDRGGMQVPNQDKLVYERMDQGAESEPKVERLLPQAEAPKTPPRQALPAPEPMPPLQPAVAPPQRAVAPQAPKPGEPPNPKPAPSAKVAAQPMETPATGYQPVQNREQVITPAQVAAVPPPPPVVQAPAPVAAAPAVKAPPGGDYVIQLGAVRAQDLAENEWKRIQKVNADLLGGLHSDIVRVELEGKGVFWRIRAAPLSETSARQLCAELTARSQGCIVGRK